MPYTTKPTTRLMQQIPIRTFSDWDDLAAGTIGVDLVGHDDGSSSGEFTFTLLATDRKTQWTEPRAVLNKARTRVSQQILVIRSLLPFELRGIHSDNGSEFVNHHLHAYCADQDVDFTRSRAYRKNDDRFVRIPFMEEQRSSTQARRLRAVRDR